MILDRAIENIQRAKALDGIITTAYSAGGAFTMMPHLAAAERMRAQISEQQHILLRQLQHLRETCSAQPKYAAGAAVQKGAAAAAVLQQLAQSQQKSKSQPMQTASPQNAVPTNAAGSGAGARPAASGNGADARGGPASQDRGASRQVQTLSSSLQLLSGEDPDCLFIVRRINKLGFKAARKLKQHFSVYGTVVRVLVAHSTVRQQGDCENLMRQRPSSLGFVHMASPEAVKSILSFGSEQEVDGSIIRVQRFERQCTDEGAADAEEAAGTTKDDFSRQITPDEDAAAEESEEAEIRKDDAPVVDGEWKRQQSSISAATTAASSSSRLAAMSSTSQADSEE
jgi:hypothetical protein